MAGTLPTTTITATRRPLLVWTYPARLLPSSITWIVGEPTARLPVLSWACPATGDFGEDVGQGAVTAEDREGVVQGPAVAGRRDAPEKDCHRRRSGSPLVTGTCSVEGKDAHGRKAELRDRGQLGGQALLAVAAGSGRAPPGRHARIRSLWRGTERNIAFRSSTPDSFTRLVRTTALDDSSIS